MPKKKSKIPLSKTHPKLAKEAFGWDPTLFTAGSSKKFAWICKQGHKFDAYIYSRTSRGDGCPYCAGRKVLTGYNDLATTHSELAKEADGWDPSLISAGSNKKLSWVCVEGHRWKAVLNNRTGNKPAGCPVCSNNLVVPGINDLATTHPAVAQKADGWDPTKVSYGSGKRLNWKCELEHKWAVPPQSQARNNGCPICSNRIIQIGFNDLATTHPNMAVEVDGWDPLTSMAGDDKKKKWICKLGHRWIATPETRTQNNSGCLVCANLQVEIGFNDLATTFPDVAKEADGWDPTTIISGHTKRKWKCVNGHKWASDVLSRTTRNIGCPSCAQHGFNPNSDGYLYFLKHLSWEMLQIGITNTPDDRLNDHKKLGWDLLEIRGPIDGHLSQQWERAILRMLKAKGADLSNSKIAGKFDGYSEAWSKSIFPVTSIKELMQLTEEF